MSTEATNAEHILLVIGRNNQNKKSSDINALIKALEKSGIPACFYESKASKKSWLLEDLFKKSVPAFVYSACYAYPFPGKHVRRLIKAILLLWHRRRWGFLSVSSQEKHHVSISALVGFIRNLKGRRISILSHSSGGIAGSLVEQEPNVANHICFGYPFKHPESPDEPRRTRHLKNIRKPFLIIQGDHDEYGTVESAGRYQLSPSIRLRAIRANHDYQDISADEFDALLLDIRHFLGNRPVSHAGKKPAPENQSNWSSNI